MKFEILSHACLYVSTKQASVIIDPWLLGSCYWRSWWNFPEPQFCREDLLSVNAVLISHVHWDHWHGPTLKKFFSGKPVYIPDEPGLRNETDLRSIGFSEVHRVPHGKTFSVGDISITLYQFGLYLVDAAIVIEAEGVTLLNVNDAKIAGLPLKHILARHGKFDFVFRSHSSANGRVCYEVEGASNFVSDDRDHYFRSFCAFMDIVKPRFSVPFASNHCHLHEDVFDKNRYISNPIQLREYVKEINPKDWELKIMLPGSSWSKQDGFHLRSESVFENLETELTQYKERVQDRLNAYRLYESNIKITERIYERFLDMLRQEPLPKSCFGRVKISIRWPDDKGESKILDLDTLRLINAPFTLASEVGMPNLIFPAVIFRDAVVKNMFHHADISKRCRFFAKSEADLGRAEALMGCLHGIELGVRPQSWNSKIRRVRAYFSRWRELIVYAQALWHIKVRKKPLYLVEEAILRGEF